MDLVVTSDDGKTAEVEKHEESKLLVAEDAKEVKKEEQRQARALFPARMNVDEKLELSPQVVPCALDLSSLQSPISMTKTPDGHLDWQLADPPTATVPMKITPNFNSPESNGSKTEDEEKDAHKGQKRFVCHYCNAEFYIRGYLTRHIKKHAVEKAYYCPFFNADAPKDARCHTTGGFSRRDTYKTHLRSRHFVCPKGVRSQEKAKSSGRCAHCNEHFENTDDWIKGHVEAGECKGLPDGFKVAIRSSRKTGKLKMIKTSNGHSRFISTQQCVIDPSAMRDQEALEATAIVIDRSKTASGTSEPAVLTADDDGIVLNTEHFPGMSDLKSRKQVSPANPILRSLDCPEVSMFSSPQNSAFATSAQAQLQNYSFNYGAPPKETSLDEACISSDPSPTDDAGLEAVNSSSSASSRISFHEQNDKAHNTNPNQFSAASENIFHFPLDIDQCPSSYLEPEFPHSSYSKNLATGSVQFDEALNKQMDAVVLSERHLRENQQYLNFYNYTFDSHL